MENCLVTKLKGAVDNSSLLKLGEVTFRTFQAETANNVTNRIKFTLKSGYTTLDVRVISGEGYLVDADMVSNQAKEKTYTAVNNEMIEIYFTNADTLLGVTPMAAVSGITIASNSDSVVKNWEIDFYKLKYQEIGSINASRCHYIGDIANFNKFMVSPYFINMGDEASASLRKDVYGDIGGEFADFMAKSQKTALPIFSNMRTITGDLVELCTRAPQLITAGYLKGTSIHCDLSKIPAESALSFISGINALAGAFTYSTRRIGGYLICTENVSLGEGLENYILDQAERVINPNFTSNTKWISVNGTIDMTKQTIIDAIAALNTKGLTMLTINGISYLNE